MSIKVPSAIYTTTKNDHGTVLTKKDGNTMVCLWLFRQCGEKEKKTDDSEKFSHNEYTSCLHLVQVQTKSEQCCPVDLSLWLLKCSRWLLDICLLAQAKRVKV